ncbi:MAG: VapC toxin family PIN domain ribonuclease [Acidobacteria bacterium]|nr:MAG: VapC toxin family PIN domain ribonuclease [Acidobacteriota bacterium]
MILLDVNVLVAAQRDDHPHHLRVRQWLDTFLAGNESFGIPGVVAAGFIRVTTHRRIFKVPTPVTEAFNFLRALRAQPLHVSISPGDRHLEIFEEICQEADVSGDLTLDAYIAAIAVESGCSLVSLDRDFARFDRLDWRLPLVAK